MCIRDRGDTYVRDNSRRRIDYVFLSKDLIVPTFNDMPKEGTENLLFPLLDISLFDSDIGDHKGIKFELNTTFNEVKYE